MQGLLKIGLCMLISALIGYERESNDKNAGLRTCMLMCLVSTVSSIVALKLYGLGFNMDISRIPSYCIAGMGFLGAGIITYNKNNQASGVTTSALLWMLVVVGITIGFGFYYLAIGTGVAVYIIIKLKYIEEKYKDK